MKKVIAIAAAMVVATTMVAMADATNWTMYVSAQDATGNAQTALQIGTKSTAQDGYDSNDAPALNAPGPTQTMAYATTQVGTTITNKDFRAPKTAQTLKSQTWVWDIHAYTQRGATAQTTPSYIKLVIKPSTSSAPVYDWNDAVKGLQHYGYKISVTSGQWYTDAAMTQSFGGVWFKGSNQLVSTNTTWWDAAGKIQGTSLTGGLSLYLKNTAGTGYDSFDNAGRLSIELTPEPGSILALGSGLAGLLGFAIRRKR